MKTRPNGFINPHSKQNKLGRLAWTWVYYLLFRPSPWFLNRWRVFLLRMFGAKIGTASIPPSVKVWAPWRLKIGNEVNLDDNVNLYNVFGIEIEDRVIISQGSFLCGASHDYENPIYPLTGGCITVKSDSWITAECFIGPGVTVDEGTVIGSRAVVFNNLPGWSVVGGNPAKVIKQRVLKD